MSKQYAFFHSQKGSGSGSGLGDHIDRTQGKEFVYSNADPSRKHLNKEVELRQGLHDMKLQDAIKFRINEGYKGEKAIRKDAVKYISHILTGSHQQMKEIEKDPTKLKAWAGRNFAFISEQFGKENIVRFSIHLDETTPHIHAVTVPITKDGRLSAKEVFGQKKDLYARQDRYAELMKPFDLERGERSSKAQHKDIQQFYAQLNELKKDFKAITDDLPRPSPKHLLNSKKWEEELKNAVNKKFYNFIGERQMFTTKALEVNKTLVDDVKKLTRENKAIKEKALGLSKQVDNLKKLNSKEWKSGLSEAVADINEYLKENNSLKRFTYQDNKIVMEDRVKSNLRSRDNDRNNDRGGGMEM